MKNKNQSVQGGQGKKNRVGRPAQIVTGETYAQLLRRLMESREDGVITLELFNKHLPLHMKGPDAVEFLQNSPKGDFIVGRQGHPSRFVFGEALEKWNHQEDVRSEWRKRNGRDPETGRLLHRDTTVRRGRPPGSTNAPKSGKIITVGGQKLRVELVPV